MNVDLMQSYDFKNNKTNRRIMIYDKLKPQIKAKMEENSKKYKSVNWLIDKLKKQNSYSKLTIDDIRCICTFGDVWYDDIPQVELMYGDWLLND